MLETLCAATGRYTVKMGSGQDMKQVEDEAEPGSQVFLKQE